MKVNIESILLVVFVFFMLLLGNGFLFNHQLKHNFPYAYFASDTFQHQTRTESIKEMGNYKYEASYICGGFKDCVGQYPPLFYHLGVIFSYTSGLETYDAAYFLVFIFILLISLTFYITARKFNKYIALLALPLSLLAYYSGDFISPYLGILWGNWPFYLGHLMLIAIFWAILNIDSRYSWILLGVFMTGLILAHTSELPFAVLFIAGYLGYRLYKKTFTKQLFKQLVYSGLLALIFSSYSLIIFFFGWVRTKLGANPTVETLMAGTPYMLFTHFGWIAVVIGIGMLLSLTLIKKKYSGVCAVAFFMFVIGFGNHFGFGRHSWRTRTLWPIYLGLFIGVTIYFLVNYLASFKPYAKLIYIGFFSAMLLSFSGLIPLTIHYEKVTGQGLMNEMHWDAFQWIRYNLEEDAKILFFYSDVYNQDAMLRNTHREHYLVVPEDIIMHMNVMEIERYYEVEQPGDSSTHYPYRQSIFGFGYHTEENNFSKSNLRDICEMDYFVFNYYGQKGMIEYSLMIADDLLNSSSMIYQNDLVLILSNNKVGGDCIANKRIKGQQANQGR